MELYIRPYCELIAAGFGKMKSPSAREREDWLNNSAAGFLNSLLSGLQVLTVKNDECTPVFGSGVEV